SSWGRFSLPSAGTFHGLHPFGGSKSFILDEVPGATRRARAELRREAAVLLQRAAIGLPKIRRQLPLSGAFPHPSINGGIVAPPDDRQRNQQDQKSAEDGRYSCPPEAKRRVHIRSSIINRQPTF